MTDPVLEDFMPSLRRTTLAVVAAAVAITFAPVVGAQKAPESFALTVDSIMRGPKLVGYPQTGLRWSGDSARLYFEWRRPGEDEASTWVVGKDGSGLRKLTDDERRNAPPVGCACDRCH